jgi:DNA-binding HxlR family transcriptional regulator
MSKASTESLINQIESGNIDTDKLRIINILMNGTQNKATLSNLLGLSHQTLTARLSELHDMGIVDIQKTKEVYSRYYFVETELEREQVRNKREQERFNKWVKLGEKNKYFEFLKDIKE